MADLFGLLQRAWRDAEPAVFLDGGGGTSPREDVPQHVRTAAAAPEAVRRASYLALEPTASLCVREGDAWWREAGGAWQRVDGEPWALLRRLARKGHALGLVGYDAGRLIERIPARAADDTQLPFLLFHRFARVERSDAPAPPEAPPASAVRIGEVRPHLTPKEFEAMVVRAKAHIRAGDVFQVNLSHRLECDVEGAPLELYARLRAVNPAPFSAFFASGPLPWDERGFHVLSSSPERLFSLRGGTLEARPIAGTRRRDADPARDEALKAELRADEKERAEHVMLVDLARNDLGRVARFGSVRVPDLLTVETYRTVHHLVSVVSAELAPGKDAVDALVAMFPGGTITGAPKVRAMEIIEEIEPVRRGIYTGSLGWISPEGDCDLNILIRSILLQKPRADAPPDVWRAHLQVGAGIVEDSEPRREYEETLAKAKGLLLALGRELD